MRLYDEIHQKVFHLLDTQLPSFLTYHSPEHTAYVIGQSEILSHIYEVTDDDRFLIRIAALFHDIGFIRHYQDHEEAGCHIASEMLQYTIPHQSIDRICGIIMATRIPQTPLNLLQQIVCDADLEYLGTSEFDRVSQLLYQELHYIDPELDQAGFRQIQIDFLTNHKYHTSYCREHREPVKQLHLQRLIEEGFATGLE